MDASEFGPFAHIVAIGCALVAVFSLLLVRMLGSIRQWTWLTADSPPFLVTAAARMVAVAAMAFTYITIDVTNYRWFGVAALATGVLGFVVTAGFDRMRKVHVVGIPLIGVDGGPALDGRNRPRVETIVIGTEADLNETARNDLAAARERVGGLSLPQFMSGYGAQKVNDPEALWDRSQLARIENQLTIALMLIVLLAVLTLFLAAFTIDVSGTSGS